MSAQEQQPQAAGKKGKKKKGTTISLTDFLGDAAPAPAVKNLDWADETDDMDGADFTYQSSYNKQIRSSLPTGPRSSRTVEVDMSKIPNEPPFTAFVGNLPYEVDEEMLAEFFKDLKILSVRLPEENGRFKGYGYVEFADKQSLVEALQHNEETFNKRQIRVDVAGSKNQDNRRGNNRYGGQGFGMSNFDGPDMTEGDWRRKPSEEYRPPNTGRGYGESDYRSDRGRDRYERDRDSYGHYGGGREHGRYDYRDRRYGNRDYQRSDSYGRDYGRGYGRDQDYGRYQGGSDTDRSYGGDRGYGRDQGYYNDRNRDDYYGRDQGYDRGYGGRDRYYGDQGGSRGYGRDQGYSDRGYGGRSGGYRDGYDNRDRDSGRYQSDRRDGYDYRRRDDDDPRRGGSDSYGQRYPDRRHSEESHEEPHVRPQLKLQPRTKPVEKDSSTADSARSSIFGGAKPVDTAAREKQIEEKMRMEQESVFHLKDEGDTYKRAPRRSSERSDDSHPSSPRRIARRISSDKDYKDAQRRRSTSPGHQQEQGSSKDKGQRDYRPAPPPKQSAWGKRPTPDKDQAAKSERKTSGSEDSMENKKPTVRPAPAPATNQWSRGPPKIDNRGVREEAEGDAREDDLNERTPEGADDTSRGSDGSAGDGSEQRRADADRNRSEKPRQHGDGRRDDRGSRGPPPARRQSYENQPDFRRRGDGGSGKRRDWDRDRPARGYEGGRGRPSQDGDEKNSRGDSFRSRGGQGQEKRRDSSRDSRPECDRSAAAGQEQDSQPRGSKGKRQPKPPAEAEQEPAIEFVQKSKFSALAIEDDEDEGHVANGDDVTEPAAE